ncbi:RNA polymerase sigma factor [Fluviispira vulneris]|uniref:RNA polymerase sigma factor n=1 Tax=Fluviispira vulneris TaxID=2763012 RepID=UPI001645935B|nr:RNA polymerase sigma factor [Fluviispira vulneris]
MATTDNAIYIDSVIEKTINWNSIFVTHSKKYWDPMFRFCLSLTNNKINAEDIHQTALFKALKAFAKFVLKYNGEILSEHEINELFLKPETQYHFKNWLYRIIKNTYLDELEIQKRWNFDTSENTLENLSNETSSHSSQESSQQNFDLKKEEKIFYQLALDDHWKKRFTQLNDRQRSIIFLAAEDYSYKEISAILEIPMGTVMSTLSRALQKLKSNSSNLE